MKVSFLLNIKLILDTSKQVLLMNQIIQLLLELLLSIRTSRRRDRSGCTFNRRSRAIEAAVKRTDGLLQLDALLFELVKPRLDLIELPLNLLAHSQPLVTLLLLDAVLVSATSSRIHCCVARPATRRTWTVTR